MQSDFVGNVVAELERCRELSKAYAEIGPAGAFGKMMIDQAIQRTENALDSGDLTDLIIAYRELITLE